MRNIQKSRILIGKPGLDGHDRGAKYVARLLGEAGYEVIYTGIRRTPEWIVAQAIEADVAAIGLSVHSGAHNHLFGRVLELLQRRGAADIIVIGGGTIPRHDIRSLESLGVRAIFTPGTSGRMILDTVAGLLSDRQPPLSTDEDADHHSAEPKSAYASPVTLNGLARPACAWLTNLEACHL
jgi:methylmalonyl-CoA mutase C-terminal domain/subunit